MRKAILGILFLILYFGVSAASYFASAGRTDLPLAWAYFLINLGTGVIFSVILEIMNPGLIAERFKPGPGEQDRVFKIASSILTVLMLVVAGLDVGRYHRSGPVAPWLQIAALVFVVLGYLFMAWATTGQPVLFFSGAVADGPRSGGGRLRAVPIGTASRIRGSYPVSCIRRPRARLVAGYFDCWRTHDCDSAAPHAA